jgi:hypothetical protein
MDEAMQARAVFEQHLCYQIQLWHLPAEIASDQTQNKSVESEYLSSVLRN